MLSSSSHELLLSLHLELGSVEAVVDLHSTISVSRHCWSRGSVRIQDGRLLVVSRWIDSLRSLAHSLGLRLNHPTIESSIMIRTLG